MDTNSFIVHVKTDDTYKDFAEDVETRFDTSNLKLDRPLPKRQNKVIGLMKDESGGQFSQQKHSYFKDNDEDKKAKGKKSVP